MNVALSPAKNDGQFPVFRLAFYLLLAALVFRFFEQVAAFLLTVYAAVILAIVLDVVRRRLPLPRKAGAVVIGLAGLLVVAAFLWLLGSVVAAQLRELIASAPAIQREVAAWLADLERRTGFEIVAFADSLARELRDLSTGAAMLGHARGVLHSVVTVFVIVLTALYALAAPNERLLTPMLKVLPASHRASVRDSFRLLTERIVGWLQGQILAMLAVGVLATAAFYLIGVPYALLLGIVNGLLDFIPIAGPWIGGVPAVIVAAVDDPMKGVWTALAITVIQQIESTFVTPLAMSNRARLHPVVTLLALVLFGGLFGFMGILLAVPLVLLIWTITEVFWARRSATVQDSAG